MNEISISADAFKAYSNELIQKTVKETLRQLRTEAVTKSEYSRLLPRKPRNSKPYDCPGRITGEQTWENNYTINMQQPLQQRHYTEYYSDWVKALRDAKCFLDMKKVYATAYRFLGIIEELLDADKIAPQLASSYADEVQIHSDNKLAIFYN